MAHHGAGMMGGHPGFELKEGEQPLRSANVRRVVSLFRPHKSKVATATVLVLITAMLGVVNPLLQVRIFDDIFAPAVNGRTVTGVFGFSGLKLLVLYVGIMVVVPILSSLIGILQTYITTVIGHVVDESQRLGELFRRLRVLAETDEHVPIRLSDFDLAIMAGELVRAYSSQASARGVELRMEAAAESSVRGDEDLLRQAAANLVENAIRYSPDGGAVVIRVAADTRQARIEVIDQGPGIDPLRLPAIFDRFQTGPGGGSGLGLAIAQSVVERHGGRIEVESRLGVGSRFAILLPAG